MEQRPSILAKIKDKKFTIVKLHNDGLCNNRDTSYMFQRKNGIQTKHISKNERQEYKKMFYNNGVYKYRATSFVSMKHQMQ